MSSDEGSDGEDALMQLEATDADLCAGFLARAADGMEGDNEEDVADSKVYFRL